LVFHSPLELDTDSFPCQVLQKWLRIHNELRLSWWNVGIYGLDGQGWKHKTANNKRLDYLHTILYKFILWWVQYVYRVNNSGRVMKSVAGAVALKDFTPTFNFWTGHVPSYQIIIIIIQERKNKSHPMDDRRSKTTIFAIQRA
jgi:hypothetical protein